jgi:Domain of unknown function (DUF4383)
MEGVRSPAQVFALVIGATLTVAGIVGFFYNASFDTGDGTARDAVLGILDVNGWHNVVHIVTGLLGLAAVGYAARAYALVLGVVYVVVAIWGFAETTNGVGVILDFLPINTEDNILHLALGLTGLAAGAATARTEPAASAP